MAFIKHCENCGQKLTALQVKCLKCGQDQRPAKKKPSAAARIIGPILGVLVIAIMVALFPTYMEFLNGASEATPASGGATTKNTQPAESENQILFDQDGITITYNGISLTEYISGAFMLTIGLTIENESDVDIIVAPEYDKSSVNDIMKVAISGLPMSALSGKKAISSFSFANLEGIDVTSNKDLDKIEKVEFQLSIRDNDSFSTVLYTTDTITIRP